MSYRVSNEDIKHYVYEWNTRFPIDRWWRQKHKIPFMSTVHRDSSFIDQYIEYTEDEIFDKLIQDRIEEEKNKETFIKPKKYMPGKGNFMKDIVVNEMTDDEFNDIDLNNF